MNAQFHLFNLEDSNEARAYNLDFLRAGVMGAHCISAQKAVEKDYQLITEFFPQYLMLIPNDCKFGTLEVYDNGAMNHFVKRDGVTIGVVTIRLDAQIAS